MMERRAVVGGGILGLTALLGGGDAAAAPAQQQAGDDALAVARAIDGMRDVVEARLSPPFEELAAVRQQQRVFLRASQKFPEFIDIGIDLWERVYDWHVRYQLPPNIARLADGRYAMTFMFTTLVLRPDQADDYISFAYDSR